LKSSVKYIFCLVTIICCNFSSIAVASPGYWAEIYDDFSYRNNWGYDNKNISSTDNLINALVIKSGYRFDLVNREYFDNDKKDLKSGIYFDIYGKGEFLYDFLGKQQNDNVFCNNEKLGAGVRVKYEKRPPGDERGFYLSSEIFGEYLYLYKSIDSSKRNYYSDIDREDFRSGFNLWSTFEKEMPIEATKNKNQAIPLIFFSELYGDFSYHTSNFATETEDDYLILVISPKVGAAAELTSENSYTIKKLSEKITAFSFEPGVYALFEYIRDFRNNDWNRNPYNNNTKYGLGGRLIFSKPAGKDFSKFSEFSINVYIEQRWINYHHRALNWDMADKDLHVGLNIWWPLGDAKYSKRKQ